MQNITTKLISAIIITSSILTFSCSKKKMEVEKPAKSENLSNLPSWVLDPSVKNGIGAVGIAAPSKGGYKFQIAAAELDAKANIASTIQSEVSRITKNSLKSAKVNEEDDVEEFFAQATKEVVKDQKITGAKRLNIYKDTDGTLYLHMALTGEDFSSFLNDSEKKLKDKLKKSNLSRDNIKKSEQASKALFDELEKERSGSKSDSKEDKEEDKKE
jgi:hypothetical protein